MQTKHDVLKANQEFYAAFRSGDFARMDALWSSRHPVSVLHPNRSRIDGRTEVMASWFDVMVVGVPPMISAAEESVILNGKRATVFCIESIGPSRVVASNLFALEDDGWKLTHHQATQLPFTVRTPPRASG